MILTLLIVSFLTFSLMIAMPGSPFASEKLTKEQQEKLEERYGLNDPFLVRYSRYMLGMVKYVEDEDGSGGSLKIDLGVSLHKKGIDVSEQLLDGGKVSVKIGLIAMGIIIVLGISFGVIAAIYHNGFLDRFFMFLSTLGVTIPSFVFASVYLVIFHVKLDWVPSYGLETPASYIGPAFAISFFSLAFITRLVRTSVIENLQMDYVRTARAKGLSERVVLFKHVLKNCLIPVVTVIVPTFGALITGSMVIERIFAIPGLGQHFTTSISNRDYPMIMGVTIFYSALSIFLIFVVDILYVLIDPRIKYDD